MSRQAIHTEQAPQAIGPYSQAIIANGFVFCAGQVALDPATMQIIDGDVKAQTAQAMKNLKAVLQTAGCTFDNVVKTTIFLASMTDFAAVNEVYATFFTAESPARSTVGGLQLPRGALVEIEMTAVLP
jgi:2-iminobutanoate/2-iminopropanoate deaminase